MFDLGKYIQNKRKEKGISQRQLGVLTNVSNTTINRLEKNTIEEPSVEILREIEKVLGLEEDYLVLLAYPPKKKEYNREELDAILDEQLRKAFNEEKIKKIKFITDTALDDISLEDLKMAVEAIKLAKNKYK